MAKRRLLPMHWRSRNVRGFRDQSIVAKRLLSSLRHLKRSSIITSAMMGVNGLIDVSLDHTSDAFVFHVAPASTNDGHREKENSSILSRIINRIAKQRSIEVQRDDNLIHFLLLREPSTINCTIKRNMLTCRPSFPASKSNSLYFEILYSYIKFHGIGTIISPKKQNFDPGLEMHVCVGTFVSIQSKSDAIRSVVSRWRSGIHDKAIYAKS